MPSLGAAAGRQMKIAISCRDCGNEFTPRPNKPGFINQCEDCATDVPLLGGNVIYEHKTAGYIEIKSMAKAVEFNKVSKRHGHGVISSIVESKSTPLGRESSKFGSGAEAGAMYYSRLGEKRSIAR